MRIRCGLLVLASFLCGATAAPAQDDPKIGLTMEVSTTVGVIWHVSNLIAIKSDIGFSSLTSDSERSATDSSGITTGVSARLYMLKRDGLRAYVSPGYFYSRTTQNSGSSSLTFENRDSTNSFAGSFGVQYALHKKLALFGETGITYSHSTFTSTAALALLGSESSTVAWRSKSGVGVIFYFR
jgi:hypothetical protein